jgi:NTP pyrophosphatase (non-canonical NTP hydrolase)
MGKLKKHKEEVVDKLWNASGRCETEKDHFMNAALGLAAEAGEVADIHKKHFFHKVNDKYRGELLLELGDVYFYLLKVQDLWGFSTKEILDANRAKLFERYNVTV